MKNLKKVLALALAFAMAFALMAGAAFSDADQINPDYVDDVNMLVELGVIAGYPDNTFKPAGNITRAEFSKMAYTLKYGSDKDGNLFGAQKSAFSDVEGNSNVAWAKGYINYCANQKIVAGVGNGKFNPGGNITVAEATKMILVIQGCDAEKEGLVGSNWMSNTVALGMQLGIYDGWAGDPTSLATRELVAKLMRNAIFAPVYLYSAITGSGSQYNSLNNNKNQTLGEQTMDLKTVTGIVIANERYAIDTDEEGKAFDAVAPTGEDSEESVVLYEAKNNAGDVNMYTLTIDRALADDMLGKKVNVFFKADMASTAEYSYKNVEVVGNVLVNSDTVAYEVGGADVEIMPNGDSTSSAEITPYISFKVDGVEKQVKAPTGTEKVAKNTNALDVAAVVESFVPYCYVSDCTVKEVGDLFHPATGNAFFTTMGEGSVAKYRFVSVDGGKTYSYIFKLLNGNDAVKFSTVSGYSEAKGTITLPVAGTLDLDEVVLNGAVEKDDYVVYYMKDGKLNIEKVETMTGALEGFDDDGNVIIGGKTYYPELNLCQQYLEYPDGLSDYYSENRGAQNEATTYYVYGNVILDIDAAATVSSVENYAVIINSSYDEELDSAYVKLGFADNSEGTYKVGKFYTKVAKTPNDPSNDRAQDYVDNARFGWIVKYSMRSDGSVDLSGQDFKDLITSGDAQVATDGVYSINEKAFCYEDAAGATKKLYGTNSNSVIFILYGNVEGTYADEDYSPIKARAYKLSEVTDATALPIAGLKISNAAQVDPIGSAIIDKTGSSRTVVAASMTHGAALTNIKYNSSDRAAYVVSGRQNYNVATSSAYATFKLISEDGLITANTIDDVTDLANNGILGESGKVGDIEGFARGTIVRFAMDAEGLITTIDNEDGRPEDIKDVVDGNDGLFYINAAAINDERLTFYGLEGVGLDGGRLDSTHSNSILLSEDGYDIITIDDDAYAGSYLVTVSRNTELAAGDYNAIIQVEEGEVIRIFSFAE